jgi:hypothetical protein
MVRYNVWPLREKMWMIWRFQALIVSELAKKMKIPSFDNIGISKEERHAPQNKLMNRFTAIYLNRSLNG